MTEICACVGPRNRDCAHCRSHPDLIIQEIVVPEHMPTINASEHERIVEILERSQRLVRRAKGLGEPVPFTTPDVCVVTAVKRKAVSLTVGDLSVARKSERGFTTSDVCVVAPQTSESQELRSEMQAKRQKQREEVRGIEAAIFEQEQEKQVRKDAAEARVRRDREQVERELAQLIRQRTHFGQARFG